MTDFDDDAAGSIASAALAVLREQGPLSLEEWATHLEEYGTATELADVLEYLSEPMLGYLPNGKYVALDTVLEGLVFTHRLSEVEIASDILDASPDLEPILAFGDGEDGAIRVALAEEAASERGAAPFRSRRVVVLPAEPSASAPTVISSAWLSKTEHLRFVWSRSRTNPILLRRSANSSRRTESRPWILCAGNS